MLSAPQSPQPLPPTPTVFQAADVPTALLALLAEAGIAWLTVTGVLKLPLALMYHLAVIGALVVRVVQCQRTGRDVGALLLLVPAVAIAGAFGAAGGLVIGWLSKQRTEDQARLARWYTRIALSTETSPMSRLSDHILSGRALDPDLAPPDPFASLISTGTIAEKQSILGLIARKFHPEYLPALQAAMISTEPVIRVQAAAVAAKIRGDLGALTERLLRDAAAATADPQAVARCVLDVQLCVQSGLMEDKDRDRSERMVEGLRARTLAQLERRQDRAVLPADAAEAVALLEGHLLAQKRFAAFRHGRRQRAFGRSAPWRWRALPDRVRGLPKQKPGARAGDAAE
jgi:hypothetical protein